jgi:23S rRNA (pseudouridine1915-N3)-methyltransferase
VRIVIATVGTPRNRALAEAIADYEGRAARYWPLDVREVRDDRLAGAVAEVDVVACTEDGARMSSTEFARWLQAARERARDFAFVIGGAFGLPDALLARAKSTLSLAPWTLPHEMARLVLAEQLYRAGTIVRGEPYHK